MEKKTYLYKGPAFRLDKNNKLYYLATDDIGNPVQYEMYCQAVSVEQASNLFKYRLRNMYAKRKDPIKLSKKYFYVKKESVNEH